jgi:hypothetical protein
MSAPTAPVDARALTAMTRRQRLAAVYSRIFRTYRAWAPRLLVLAVVVFVPLGLLDALLNNVDTDSLNVVDGLHIAALVAAIAAITATSLFGEVFYSGAVAISLTHPEGEEPPTMLETARRISYLKLIAVDLIYVATLAIGFFLFLVPGVVAFVFLGLAGPIVEIEERGVFGAFRRSIGLVRRHFWLVLCVLGPVEVVGDAVGEAVTKLVHHLLGESFVATWAAESASNIVFTPFFAIAVVLLTLDLIAATDGRAPTLNRHPAPLVAPAAEA